MSAAAMNVPPAARKARYAQVRTSRGRPTIDAYARYEADKGFWLGSNPNAVPEQYDAAMRAIAKSCGV